MAAKKKPVQVETASKTKHPGGRPIGSGSAYCEEIADEICERLSNGEPLAQICRDERMPAYRTAYLWQDTHPEFAAKVARAREDGYESLAVDCLHISDDNGLDHRFTEKGAVVVDGDVIQRAKLRVDTRLKLLACWSPKRYGTKIDVQQTTRVEPVSADQMADEMRQSPALRKEIEEMLAKSSEL